MYANFQIPVVPDTYNSAFTAPGADATTGRQFITVSANPLGAGIPIRWTKHTNSTWASALPGATGDLCYYNLRDPANWATAATGAQTRGISICDPLSWAQMYDEAGLGDLVSKIYTFGQLSNKHRIVGCALKTNIGADTTLARGQIEAGQYELSEVKKNRVNGLRATPTDVAFNGMWAYMDVQPATSTIADTRGQIGDLHALIMNNDYATHKQVIWPARNDSHGVMLAADGACVRWTDSNNFKFYPTVNKCLMVPDIDFYDNGEEGENVVAEDTNVAYTVSDPTYLNCNIQRRHRSFGTGAQKGSINCIAQNFQTTTSSPQYSQWLTADRTQRVVYGSALQPTYYSGTNGPFSLEPEKAAMIGSINSPDGDFDRGLYVDITGVNPYQVINIEVQWFIEYIPKVYSLTIGRNPPIDMNFPAIQAMVQDNKTYPIVVKGHSFFSSLWHAVKRGAEGAGKLLSGTSKLASLIPDPRAQAFAGIASTGGGMLTGIGRL
jgi:hypothetical protein